MSMGSSDAIESVLKETRTFPPPQEVSANANIKTEEEYQQMWQQAKEDPAGFWGRMAENLDWSHPFDKVFEGEMPQMRTQPSLPPVMRCALSE